MDRRDACPACWRNWTASSPNRRTSVELIARAIVDEPPLAVKEGGMIRDGFDAALDELRTRDARRQGLDREAAAGRNHAHRHPVAQGAVQLRVRLLHRGHEGEPRQGAAALHPQADHRQRRAVHHAGAEGDGRQNPRRGGAQREAGIRAVPARARGGARRSWPRIQQTAAALAQLDVLGALRRNRAAATTIAARRSATKACCTSATAGIRCWSRTAERALRAE